MFILSDLKTKAVKSWFIAVGLEVNAILPNDTLVTRIKVSSGTRLAEEFWSPWFVIFLIESDKYFVFFDNWTAIERKGKILNDTTIEMLGTKTLNGYHKDKAMPDFGRFNYRQFQNKPDSLNWMMKDKYYQNKVRTRKMIGEK